MPLYFAYGSNMHAPQMAERCPAARPVGPAVLGDHRFLINERGVATIRREAGAAVWGVLWQTTPACMAALDRFEGIHEGRYDRAARMVGLGASRRHAITYIDRRVTPGAGRAGYLDGRVIPGAQAFRLPDAYLAELAAWLAGPPAMLTAVPRWRARM